MENYGLTSVGSFLGDNIVYRNLQPMDNRLPTFADIADQIGINRKSTPRKSESDYARVMAYLLRRARALTDNKGTIDRLIYVGDTQLNDGTAFANLCRAGTWPGMAFIGSEKPLPPAVETVTQAEYTLTLANRWSMLTDFDHTCRDRDFAIDEHTAVILDLDKTTLGARGRNDHVINAARLEAVRQTVQELLGNTFNAETFESTYDLLNDTEFHPFTTDNQDYLAYMCLILGGDLFTCDNVVVDIRNGTLKRFTQFLERVEARAQALPDSLRTLHEDIYSRVLAGDPTPFKAFRYNEYRTTVGRMGTQGPAADVSTLLQQEIVITQEVREIAQTWLAQGALLFGLSDKPDEASIPTPELARAGYQPIHRQETHAVGTARNAT